MKPILEIQGLSKKYQIHAEKKPYLSLRESLMSFGSNTSKEEFYALQDVSFTVQAGESIGIIGKNGAGKSTLLKILSRITPPSKGKITVRGRIASLLEVGTGFHPELSGRENIFLNGSILGMKRQEIKAKLDEIIDFSGVEKFLDTPLKHYSSGMQLRLAFAVAAFLEPEILIIDEVLAVGDAEFQKKCMGKMESVSKSGRTVLFVSHNTNAVLKLCQKSIWLQQGKLLKVGDSNEIITSYLSSTTNSYFKWENNGFQYENAYFKPTLLQLQSIKTNAPQGEFNVDEGFFVVFKGIISEINPLLTIGISVSTIDGLNLFWSYQTDTKESQWPQLSIGENTFVFEIPPNYLNEGEYIIELIGGIHYRTWICTPNVDAPSVKASLKGKLSESPYWTVKRSGLLAPILKVKHYV